MGEEKLTSESSAGFPLDHVAFGVASLESGRARLAALGFTGSDPAICRWEAGGSAESARSTSVVFADSYFDLIENQSQGWRIHLESSPLYQDAIAPSGVVVSAADLTRIRRMLAERGQRTSEPYAIERSHPVMGEPPPIDYRLSALEGSALPLALIEDSDPAAMRVPAWLDHPNTALGVHAIHLRVPSIAEALAARERFLGAGSDARGMQLGDAALKFHEEPLSGPLGDVGSLQPHRDRPALLALELRVQDLSQAAAQLGKSGIAFEEEAHRITVDPRRGLGCAVWFRSADAPGDD